MASYPMSIGLPIRARFQSIHLCFSLNQIFNQRHYETLTIEMGSQNPPKRPVCPSCSKPIRLCLCARFKSPLFDNSISVTILQHNHEKKHPLNSTRIATLGLKNLTLATVSDVHFEAKFLIRLPKPNLGVKEASRPESVSLAGIQESHLPQEPILGSNMVNGCVDVHTYLRVLGNNDQIESSREEKKNNLVLEVGPEVSEEPTCRSNLRNGCVDVDWGFLEKDENPTDVNQVWGRSDLIASGRRASLNLLENGNLVRNPISYGRDDSVLKVEHGCEAKQSGEEEIAITAIIEKCGFTCSLTSVKLQQNDPRKLDFDMLLDTQIGRDAISNGFVVKKLQKMKLADSVELVEVEEFEIVVPPGSALLFPTKKSIGFGALDFEVKHLIVLDGTWAKAKRMYHENPWLKLLPQVKLDQVGMSLYSEVRQEPQEGCLSTIESVVYALKALGNDHEDLDNLLDVFESMVGDQRRCKDERISNESQL